MAQGAGVASDASAFAAWASSAVGGSGAYPSDEEILGIGVEEGHAARGNAQDHNAAADGAAPFRAASPEEQDAGRSPAATPGDADAQAVRSAADAPRAAAQAVPAAPEWLKPLLADPKVGREAQTLWEQHQAYREIFPTVAEARAVKELFPGGAEEARHAFSKSEQLDQVDAAYFSGDPRTQAELAQYLAQQNPRAFQSMLSLSAQVLARSAPAAYQELAGGMVRAALAEQRFDQHVARMREARERGDQESLGVLTDQLAAWAERVSAGGAQQARPGAGTDGVAASAGHTPLRETGPEGVGKQGATQAAAELARQREELERERGEFRATQYAAFQESANDAVVGRVRSAVEQTIASALPGNLPGAARKRIAESIFSEINTTLQADRGLTRQVAEILRQWNFDEQTRQQVVGLIFSRAKSLIPAVARRVVGEWTSSVVGASRQKAEKQDTAARRVDIVGGGAAERVARKAITPRDIDYSTTSDDQILSL